MTLCCTQLQMYSRVKHRNRFNSHLFTIREGWWGCQKSLCKLSTSTSLVMPPQHIHTLSWWIDCQICLCQGNQEASRCWVIYRTKLWKRDTPLTDDSSACHLVKGGQSGVCLFFSTALLYVCVCVYICVGGRLDVQAGACRLTSVWKTIDVLVVQYSVCVNEEG